MIRGSLVCAFAVVKYSIDTGNNMPLRMISTIVTFWINAYLLITMYSCMTNTIIIMTLSYMIVYLSVLITDIWNNKYVLLVVNTFAMFSHFVTYAIIIHDKTSDKTMCQIK